MIGEAGVSFKCCLIVSNPAAGRVTRAGVRSACAILERAGVGVVLYETTAPGDGRRRAREAAGQGDFFAVIAAGGDGTVREVAGGLVDAGKGRAGPALGVLPLGTTNVLARELAIPFDIGRAVDVIVAGRGADLYLGIANGNVFTTMAGVGFDASVVASVDTRLKSFIGRGAYVAAAARSFVRMPARDYEISISGRGVFKAASVVIAKSLYYGGPFSCAPQARVDVPELHFCLFEKPGRLHALRYVAALGMSRLHKTFGYSIVTGREATILGPPGEPVQADGDIVTRLPLEVGVTDEPLLVLRPDTPAPHAG